MAAQIAITAGKSQGPSPTGNTAISALTSRTAGAHEFANGLQALLAAAGNSDVAADAPSTSNPNPGAVLADETMSGGSAQLAGRTSQSDGSNASHLGLKKVSIQPRLSPLVQRQRTDSSPILKDSQSSLSAATSVIPSREKKALLAARVPDTNLSKPTAQFDVATTAPVQSPVASAALLAAGQQVANAVAPTPHVSTIAVAEGDQLGATPAIPAASTGLSESAKSSPQIPPDQITNGLQSATRTGHNGWALPSIAGAPADQSETNSGLTSPHLSSIASDASAASLQVDAPGPVAALDPGFENHGVRRMDALSAGRYAGSARKSSASSVVGDIATQHAPAATLAGMAAGMATVPGHGGGQPDRGASLASPSRSASPSQPDTFTALDSAATGPATTWIHAGAHHVEAGYLDPALGWVSVRADGTADGVHAALVPGSPEAASALGNQLAGLNAFMAGHQGHTATVTLVAPESGNAHPGTAQQDSSMSGQHNPQQPQDRNQAAPYTRGSSPSPKSLDSDSVSGNIALGVPHSSNGSGVHLSVMA